MTDQEIREQADKLRGERLNETGRAAIDMWEMLMLEFIATPRGRANRATLANAAEKWHRAAQAADKLQDAENIANLLALQEEKAAASARARRFTVVDGGA